MVPSMTGLAVEQVALAGGVEMLAVRSNARLVDDCEATPMTMFDAVPPLLNQLTDCGPPLKLSAKVRHDVAPHMASARKTGVQFVGVAVTFKSFPAGALTE